MAETPVLTDYVSLIITLFELFKQYRRRAIQARSEGVRSRIQKRCSSSFSCSCSFVGFMPTKPNGVG